MKTDYDDDVHVPEFTRHMRAYSEDLRARVVAAVDQGMPRAEVTRLFQVSAPTIKRWLRLRRETGRLAARPIPGPPARKAAALRVELPAQIEAHPGATLDELCRWWEKTHGSRVSRATVSRVLSRELGLGRRATDGRRRGRRESVTMPRENGHRDGNTAE